MQSTHNADQDDRVLKRNGEYETVSFDKILRRIKRVGKDVGIQINYTSLAMKVIDQLYDGISTTKIDELTAEQCASLSSTHPDYNVLAGRIIVSNHQKNTLESFSDAMEALYNFRDKKDESFPLISDALWSIVLQHGQILNAMIDHNRDYLIDYFGFKTLERAYLMKVNGKTVERPQHMWLRVSLGIHGTDLEKAKETYDLMSKKYFTHATPTLFNAGTPRPQLSSCFLLSMENDSIDGIYNTLKDCALISKMAGGIGLHIHNIRAKGSHIRGTNGTSNGIVPMLRVFNNTAKYVDQCVPAGTVIYTTQGPLRIENCIAGETKVLNATGQVEVIQNVLEHSYSGKILKICTLTRMDDPQEETQDVTPLRIENAQSASPSPLKSADSVAKPRLVRGEPLGVLNVQRCKYKTDSFRITSEHPVLINRNDEFDWVDAGELMKGDKLVTVVPQYSVDLPEFKNIDCIMYGILYQYTYVRIYTIEIRDSNPLHDELIQIIRDYFEYYAIEYVTNKVECNSMKDMGTEIQWKASTVCPLRQAYVYYDRCSRKAIHHKILNLPIEKLDSCLKYIQTGEESYKYARLKLRAYNPDGFMDQKPVVYGKIISINEEETNGETILYDLQMKLEHNYLLEAGIVHNGGGKRNGSFAIYLEPWHADIESFLEMRKNHGDEELKARDLFYALWIPDLFMERVKSDSNWTLMCPDECPGLSDVYSDKFVALYESYELAGKGRKTMKARELWFKMLDAQMETGTPYMCYKDAANKKSNQKNLGTIKSSNLCTEIMEYSDDKETAVCNLASIALPTFVKQLSDSSQTEFDYDMLHHVTKVVTKNLDKVIDVNYYPTPKTYTSNMNHRPIGLGVQGLADTFIMLGHAFDSEKSREINRLIFETIYHAALEASCEIAVTHGKYSSFDGSPASMGILQFDMWNVTPTEGRYDWQKLKDDICRHGLRNSLLVAPMPTASTSQILGFNECIEPITSNIYSRRTNAGEFVIANKYLMKDLMEIHLWNDKIKNNIIANNGSIQHLEMIPQELRNKYKTVWELPMRSLIDMAADRGAYICQSQSLNLWVEDPNYSTLTSMHFYAWTKGLKTGIYYLRRRARHQAQQFTIEPEKAVLTGVEEDDICEMCSS